MWNARETPEQMVREQLTSKRQKRLGVRKVNAGCDLPAQNSKDGDMHCEKRVIHTERQQWPNENATADLLNYLEGASVGEGKTQNQDTIFKGKPRKIGRTA